MKRRVPNILRGIFAIALVLLIAFPFLWLLLGSFKTMRELFAVPVVFWPEEWKLDNYAEVFRAEPFLTYITNSLGIATIATVVVVFASSLASYTMARVNIKGKKLILMLVLTVSLLPPITLLNPIYQMLANLNALNTWIGLALVMSAVELPTAIWLLTSFFQSVPMEIEESAMIDGASMLRSFTSIVMPLVAPGVFTVSIMTFITVWNNYLFASVFNQRKSSRTVTVGLTLIETEAYRPWHVVSAAAIISSVPLIIIVLLLQKRIISGMVEGGVKE